LTTETVDATAQPARVVLERQVIAKVTRRLIPFMFLMYILNYLDRTNVGFAKLTMMKALNMSDLVYGTGMGVFFIAYFIFEVPSNIIMEKVGARIWMARIMVTWGIISCAIMFATNAASFYTLRFLLGVAEAGFFPGMILYLTYWFPAAERARAISRFMTATPLAGAIGSPVSGILLDLMKGVGGLQSWQWLFIVEGIPSVIVGLVAFFYLTDRPAAAHWLTTDEKQCLMSRLEREDARRRDKHSLTLLQALSNRTVLHLSVLYLAMQIGFYGFGFWLADILKSFGLSAMQSGFVAAIPYTIAAVCMVVVGTLSDRSGERKRFVATACGLAALGMTLTAICIALKVDSAVPPVLALTVAAIGLWSTLGPFWSLPTSFLTGAAAAGGIAFINSVGNLGGQIGPTIMGAMKQVTHSNAGGLYALTISLLLAAVLALTVHHDRSLEHADD
jgi:ACS family tartrate transporter-like MFS transporter